MKYPEGPGAVDNRYQEGDPTTALAATTLRAVDMNALTYEIINVIEGAGLALDPGREDQLLEAITKMIEENLAPDASETTKGIVELATAAETETGTDKTRAVTPSAAQAVYLKRSQNLAGLADVAAARANIEAMHTGANLADVADPAAARSNLGFSNPILNKAAPGDIGTTTPGNARFNAVTSEGGVTLDVPALAQMRFERTDAPETYQLRHVSVGDGRLYLRGFGTAESEDFIAFDPRNGQARVGIRTLNPSATLDVNGSAAVGSLVVGGGATIARVLSAAATLNFGTLNPGDSATRTMTVSGASAGDPVFLGWNAGHDLRIRYRVSGTDLVSIYVENTSSTTTYNLADAAVRAVVFKF